MRLLLHALPLLLAASSLAQAAGPSPVDQMSQAAIQSAFQVLRRDYIRREDLSFTEVNRAALEGLLARLAFGAEFVLDEKNIAPPAPRLVAEQLSTRTGYLRPTTCQAAEVEAIEAKLKAFAEAKLRHLILDLRTPAVPGEFEVAAALLDLFLPEGQVMFKLKQLDSDQAQLFITRRPVLWEGNLVVLVDGDTCNVAEITAAVLRDQRRALLVGAPTRGATVRYQSVPVEQGWRLRFASAEMLLPDDRSVFRKGLAPDLLVPFESKTKLALFSSATVDGKVKSTIVETPRPRFNESALVHGANPELDDYVLRSRGVTPPGDSRQPRDLVLQRALDMLSARDHLSEAMLVKPKSLAKPSAAKAKAAEPEIKPAMPVK